MYLFTILNEVLLTNVAWSWSVNRRERTCKRIYTQSQQIVESLFTLYLYLSNKKLLGNIFIVNMNCPLRLNYNDNKAVTQSPVKCIPRV